MQEQTRTENQSSDDVLLQGGPAPSDGPLFVEGEVVTMRGFQFRLTRVNRSSLVFRPLKHDDIGAPWRVVREIT